MSGSITVDVSEALRAVDPKRLDDALKAALDGAADLLRNELRRYPAPPPASSYVRTGTLGKSWAKRVNSREAIIGNATGYAPYVQDDEQQAKVHRGRWKTTGKVAQEQKEAVRRFIVAALERWAR